MVAWLGYKSAAMRVGRDERTIKRWHRQGMPMSWRVGSDGQRERVVELDVLLSWWRERLTSSPVHYYRMRRQAREDGRPDPPKPSTGLPSTRPAASPAPAPAPDAVNPSDHVADDDVDQARAERERAWVEVERAVLLKAGGWEYAELQEALARQTPACHGLEMFSDDGHVGEEQSRVMAGICAACPVVSLCRSFAAVAQPEVGFWAGAPAASYRQMMPAASVRTQSAEHSFGAISSH